MEYNNCSNCGLDSQTVRTCKNCNAYMCKTCYEDNQGLCTECSDYMLS